MKSNSPREVKWKPRFKVVPGTDGRIWYMIQYVQTSYPLELYPQYRFFWAHQIRWFMKLKNDRPFHRKAQRDMLNWNIAYFQPVYGWYRQIYWRREPTGDIYEITQSWLGRGKSRLQLIINFLIDEGYGYAKRGIVSPILLRPRGQRRLSDLGATFAELAASGERESDK